MTRLYRAVRLHRLPGDRDTPADQSNTHLVPASPHPAPRPLRTGVHSLALLNLSDTWRPWIPRDAEVHGFGPARVQSSAGIVALPSGIVIEDTFGHADPLADGYERLQSDTLPTANGESRPEGGRVRLPPPQRHLAGRHLSLLMPGSGNQFHWPIMNLARAGLLDDADMAGLHGILVPAEPGPERVTPLVDLDRLGHARA